VLKLKQDNIYNVTGDINMKITKQRLKEIIKEELENSQNKADQLDEIDMGRVMQLVKGRLFRIGTEYYDFHANGVERLAKKLEDAVASESEPDILGAMDAVERSMAMSKERERKKNLVFDFIPNRQQEKVKAALDKLDQAMAKASEFVKDKEDKRQIQARREQYRKEQEDRERRKRDEEAMERMRKEIEDEYNQKRWARQSAERERNRSRSSIDVSGRGFAYGDNPGRAGYSVREDKITKDALKGIIAEELTKAEKSRKKELEKELDDLKHK
tara:strand:- start:5727 stop:6542 length:816 start_codon:yes stop_codon:yes gene_type:complete